MSVVEERPGMSEDTQKDKYLTFHLAGEDYAFEIYYVTEIVGIQKITAVPRTPQYVKGVINLRGQVIPVMDVRLRFGLAERDYDERTCVIVVRVDTTAIGLVVDKVNEVVDIPESRVELVSQQEVSDKNRFIKGMGKLDSGVKIVLNLRNLLYDAGQQHNDEE
jgi:purine-binding chemotaxis protein CheW